MEKASDYESEDYRFEFWQGCNIFRGPGSWQGRKDRLYTKYLLALLDFIPNIYINRKQLAFGATDKVATN